MDRKLTLAQRHYLRTQARESAGAAPHQESDAERLMRAALWADRRTLHDIKSMERKVAAKAEMLPRYADYVAGVLEGDSGRPDEVLMTVMVWRFDCGDLAGGLAIAGYAMRHGLRVPDRFARDTPTVIAEEVAEQILAALDTRRQSGPVETDAGLLVAFGEQAQALTEASDIHDQVRAKLAKALGYALRAAGQNAAAMDYLRDALRLYPAAGVKKDIERLQRLVDKQSAEPVPAPSRSPAEDEQE